MDKTSLTLCQSTLYQITKAADSEDADYDKVIARYRSEGLGDATKDMKIVPVNFNRAQSHVRALQNDIGTGSWKNCNQPRQV
jgi:hypothetical protein